MKSSQIIYSILIALLLTGCVNDALDVPDISDKPFLTISFSTDGYNGNLTRTESEETLCWSDWNEKKIESLDFYLIGNDGKISYYNSIDYDSNDCNVGHTILQFKENGVSNLADLTFDMINGSSQIAIVANYPLDKSTERIRKTFNELYTQEFKFSDNQHIERQEKFVMVGVVNLPDQVSKYSNIVVPLRRIIAKIRVRVMNMKGEYLNANDFKTVLCRYSNTAKIIPDALMPEFNGEGYGNNSNIFPAKVVPTGKFAQIEEWSYPSDITEPHPSNMVREEEGHVYYTCPYDWVDYSKVKNSCSRSDQSKHTSINHKDGKIRYEVIDSDDAAPILKNREMFLLLKAPYSYTKIIDEQPNEVTEYFLYKIPINYRISTINDQQCFSESDLIDKVFNLYRAERNHFYDITVLIDQSGYPVGMSQ